MSRVELAASSAELPLSFETNRGQSDPAVDYISRGSGYTIFLRRPEAVLVLTAPHERNSQSSTATAGVYAVRLRLEGASALAKSSAIDQLPGRVNYFIGNDPDQWRTNIATYRRVQYCDIYPAIDVVYYGRAGQLEYDFILRPGADPRQIRLTLEGAKSLKLNRSGDLLVLIDGGELVFHKPILYQKKRGNRVPVSGRYSISGSTVRFSVGNYDRSRELVLDPVLAYATYLGGSTNDNGQAIMLDSSGAVYLTGYTQSTNFPTTPGAYSTANSGTTNAVVTKLSPGGSGLTYSTYLGGSVTDQGNGIAVDGSGNAYVTGFTQSANFPVVNALPAPNNVLQGSQNAFVAEISPNGSTLIYSTYLGGSQTDVGNAVAVDPSGNAYVAGTTQSTDFPTVNGYQTALAGTANGFVSEIQPGGGALLYSTFLGGTASDSLNALTLTPPSTSPLAVYVAGQTQSTNFPTTTGVLQPNCAVDGSGNCNDAVIAAINPANSGVSSLVFATFLGGTSTDAANAVTADATGIYVVGTTSSTDFPVMHAPQATYGGGSSDAFAAKLQTNGTALLFSTFVGGSLADEGTGVAVDSNGNTYVTGSTLSSDFPAFNTLPAPNNANQGGSPSGDAFLTKLNSAGSTLIVSTFLGGTGSDQANAVAVDANGNAYVAGSTTSQDMPVSANAFQPDNAAPSGSSNVFFVELSQLAQPVANLSATSLSFGSQQVGTASAAQTVTFSNFGDAPLTISNIATAGDYQVSGCSVPIAAAGNCQLSVTFTPTTTGDRPGTVTITDNASGSPRMISLDGTGIAPAVSLSPTSLAFGQQNVNTTSTPQSVTLTNIGSAPLTITSITVSANYVLTNGCSSPLAAGAPCTVLVSFSPQATGTLTGQLSIADNAAGAPQTVGLSGSGVLPAVSISPVNLALGTQTVGTTSPTQPVTFSSTGSGTLIVSGISIGAPFSISSNTCGVPLSPGSECKVKVSFNPTAVQKYTGSLAYTTNVPTDPPTVAITGTGIAPVTLSPASSTYVTQMIGTNSPAQTFTLANNQGTAIDNLAISTTGDFAVSATTCVTTLTAKGKCTIGVTFSPTATGTRSGTLQVTDNASDSPQTASLTGMGAVPSTSWTFVQAGHCAAGGGASGCTISLSSNLTPGNLYVFMAYLNSGAQDNVIASVSAAGSLVLEPGCHGRLTGSAKAPTCAYILPSTSGGGASPITVNFSEQTAASSNSWVYMAEFQPIANGNIAVDNAGALYLFSSTTQTGPIFTPSSTGDVTCAAIMLSTTSVHVSAVGSPYDAPAYLPGTAEGFSCAASNTTTTPAWTPATQTGALAMGFSIGMNPTPGMEQSFIDFEGGSDGAAPTAATLAASTHGWQGGQWELGAKTMVLSSAASQPLQNATGRLLGDGINYPCCAGTLGIQITGAAPTAQADYIRYDWFYSNLTDMTVGAWYYTNLPAGDPSDNDCLAIHGAGQQFAAANCYGGPKNRYIGLETPAGLGTRIPINSNTWYWIQIHWYFDGTYFTHTVKVWDTNGNLVGISSYGPYAAAADYPAYINIGKANSSTMTNGKIQYLDSVKISLVGDDPIGQ